MQATKVQGFLSYQMSLPLQVGSWVRDYFYPWRGSQEFVSHALSAYFVVELKGQDAIFPHMKSGAWEWGYKLGFKKLNQVNGGALGARLYCMSGGQ